MEAYVPEFRRQGIGVAVWPLSALVLFFALFSFITTSGYRTGPEIVLKADEEPGVALARRQLVVANILNAFEDPNLILNTPVIAASPSDSEVSVAPALSVRAVVSPADAVISARQREAPIPPQRESELSSLSALLEKMRVPIASSLTPTGSSEPVVAPSIPSGIQQMFEIPIIGIGGGGGGSSAPVAPAAIPVPAAPLALVAGAPTMLTSTAGNAQVALSWGAPASDGGAAITDYEIRQSTDNFVSNTLIIEDGVGTTTSYIVTGLMNGATYYFQVGAVNIVGTSTLSEIASSTPVSPATVPGVPHTVIATAGNAQLALSWTVPASDGGSVIIDYEIRQSTDNFATERVVADGVTTATSTSIAGLVNGTTYSFKIAAVNAVGTSTLSSTVNATPVAPATVPHAPTNIQGTPHDGSIDLTWDAPASDGGSAITDYEIHYSSDNFVSDDHIFAHPSSPATAITIDGLVNDTDYYVRIRSVNAIGSSTVSDIAGPFMPTGLPPIFF